jgi:hypothetical protein
MLAADLGDLSNLIGRERARDSLARRALVRFPTMVQDVKNLSVKLRTMLFSISPEEATVGKRGFHTWDDDQRLRIEKVGATFLEGYHAAIEEARMDQLGSRLNAVESEYRGFAFEGAGMGLAILDLLTPWNRGRVEAFLSGSGAAHVYMVHVGIGWAFARVPFGMRSSFNPRSAAAMAGNRWYGFPRATSTGLATLESGKA